MKIDSNQLNDFTKNNHKTVSRNGHNLRIQPGDFVSNGLASNNEDDDNHQTSNF